jgi:glycosyltransferase involved in cell wall biosynthesis
MRIGIDYRSALINSEGIGRYVRELVRAMVEIGFDEHLGLFGYTLTGANYSRAELGIKGSRAELCRLRFPARYTPGLLRLMKKGVDDLVGGCEVFHHILPHRLEVRQAVQVSTIFDAIYTLDAGYLAPEAAAHMTTKAKELVECSERILVPSEYVGAELVMALGAHPSKIMVTHLGCDHIARELPPEGFGEPRDPYILTVSRVDARKNHLRMLEAFELLVKEGLPHRWIIAGPPGHGAEVFREALANSPVRDRVEWREDVSDEELPKLYSQAAVFLFASLNEGFGLPPLEAMACGTPVVSSAVTSLPEVCGDAAFLVEPTDSERIFEATRRLLTESDLAESFKVVGRQRARKFTWAECAKSTLLAYRAAQESAEKDEEPSLLRVLQ